MAGASACNEFPSLPGERMIQYRVEFLYRESAESSEDRRQVNLASDARAAGNQGRPETGLGSGKATAGSFSEAASQTSPWSATSF